MHLKILTFVQFDNFNKDNLIACVSYSEYTYHAEVLCGLGVY